MTKSLSLTIYFILLFAFCAISCPYSDAAKGATAAARTAKLIVETDKIEIDISNSKAFTATPSPNYVSVSYASSKASICVSPYIVDSIALLPGNTSALSFSIKKDPQVMPPSNATQFTVTINDPHSSDNNVSIQGIVYNKTNISSLVSAAQAALSVASTTNEKDLFAGLNISVPSSNATSGGVNGQLNYNYSVTSLPNSLKQSRLYDSGNVGLNVNAGSTTSTSARSADVGLSARKTFLFISASKLDEISKGTSADATPAQVTTAVSALDSAAHKFVKAAIIDYGFQMEGDVSTQGIGSVSNAIFTIRPQLATGSTNFAGGNGYFSLRFMPVGTELGENISKPTANTGSVGSLVRATSGLDVNVYYLNPGPNSFIKKVELTGDSAYRHLFENESAYNPTTSTTTNVTAGNHWWDQVDFKIFSSKSYGSVQPGIKVSYQDGSLPPVYNKVHTFTYGLVFESSK